MSELLGFSRTPLYHWIRLAKQLRIVHVCGWEAKESGPPIQIFKIGNRRDADRPKPQGRSVSNRKHWLKRVARIRQEEMIRATASPIMQAAQ